MPAPFLFPAPREIDLGGPGADPASEPVVRADPRLPAQGYELTVSAEGVTIHHADELGLRYGRDTLAQLRAQAFDGGCKVRDWPTFEHRGYMLDISRDRVPTMETLDWLVDRLARARVTELQCYTEHTFAYRDHEVVWRDASPLTHDEMRMLDERCSSSGVELVANQNCFGHFERWLAHPDYRQRAEAPQGWELPGLGGRRPPSTLAPSIENAELVLDLVAELTSCVTSRRVNVGCDETFELGQGVSAARVAAEGKSAVFTEHLLRIVEPLIEDGYEVQFWGDMIRRDPALVDRLPPSGATALAWNYEAPSEPGSGGLADLLSGFDELRSALGMPDDAHLGFASHARVFAEGDYPFWVCPGTSTWNTLVGRWTNARDNIADAARIGPPSGARGALLTDWGDNGHMQPLAVSMLPLAAYAGAAWCAETNTGSDTEAACDTLLRDTSGRIGGLLARIGDAYRHTGLRTVNGSPIFAALFREPPLPAWGEVDRAGVAAVRAQIEGAIDEVGVAHLEPAVRDELVAALRLARHGLLRIAARVDRSAADLDLDRAECIELQRAAWLARSRPGGLDDSLARLGSPE